jgi:hypothetical protein
MKGFSSAGVDFDDLFDPDVMGNGPAAAWLTSAGVPLRYAAISYGAKGPDVGFIQSNGQDVSNLWARKGSAVYFPGMIRAETASAFGGVQNASASIRIRTDGTVVVTTSGLTSQQGAGTYRYGASSAGLDFRVYGNVNGIRNSTGTSGTITGKGGVNFAAAPVPGNTANFDTGWQANADDAANFLNWACGSQANQGAAFLDGNVYVQIRRKSDLVVLSTWGSQFYVMSDSQS